MRIFITIPSFAIHGGIRVILEWANRLAQWHEVHLHNLSKDKCNWFDIDPRVIIAQYESMHGMDCLIITSPHSIHFEDRSDCPDKVFIFAQMAEHLFKPTDRPWVEKCMKFYLSKHPMISISSWNMGLFASFGRTAITHYVGNGVNLDHFPISTKPKDGKTVLVEGWECMNSSKDASYLSARVARELKEEGFYIIAFSQCPLIKFSDVPDEYYVKPPLQLMNELYERATIMLKASKYDARSCAPMEAMTKGTVTARAIEYGDDDLYHGSNCLRSGYNLHSLLNNSRELLYSSGTRRRFSEECIRYVKEYNWDYWMEKINDILCKD